jgi:hypothetical protein
MNSKKLASDIVNISCCLTTLLDRRNATGLRYAYGVKPLEVLFGEMPKSAEGKLNNAANLALFKSKRYSITTSVTLQPIVYSSRQIVLCTVAVGGAESGGDDGVLEATLNQKWSAFVYYRPRTKSWVFPIWGTW